MIARYFALLLIFLGTCSPWANAKQKGYLILNIQNLDSSRIDEVVFRLGNQFLEDELTLRRITTLPGRVANQNLSKPEGGYLGTETIGETIGEISSTYSTATGQESLLFEFDLPNNYCFKDQYGPAPVYNGLTAWPAEHEATGCKKKKTRRAKSRLFCCCTSPAVSNDIEAAGHCEAINDSQAVSDSDAESGISHYSWRGLDGYDAFWESSDWIGFTAGTTAPLSAPLPLLGAEAIQRSDFYYSIIIPQTHSASGRLLQRARQHLSNFAKKVAMLLLIRGIGAYSKPY